jgi:uncharacterized damage-inducible protein DinB
MKGRHLKTATLAPEIARLLRLIDEAFQKKSWHGTNLRGSIRGLSARQAGWRPSGAKHSIADLVVHCAYWKYAVRRRLRGDPRGSFPLKGSNWFKLPDPLSASAWREFVALLETEHRALRGAVTELSAGQIEVTPKGRQTSNRMLIHGIVLHDIYHAGQIQLLKALARQRET